MTSGELECGRAASSLHLRHISGDDEGSKSSSSSALGQGASNTSEVTEIKVQHAHTYQIASNARGLMLGDVQFDLAGLAATVDAGKCA